MGQIDNQAQGNFADIFRRLRALEFASNQNNMAVGRGGIRVHGGGGITIENGGLNVTGTATISGVLEATGSINMSGTFTATGTTRLSGQTDIWGPLTVTGDTDLDGLTTINGDTTVTGDFTVNGPMKTTGNLEVSGTMDIKGAATLNNDLTVSAGKQIKLGGLTLENTGTGGGTLNFPNGSVSSGSFGMLLASSVALEIAAPTMKWSGLPTTSGVEPNLYMDGAGNIKRIIP
jgi:hypothetical protein